MCVHPCRCSLVNRLPLCSSSKMPILDKCCFCIALPTGGIILGALSLVGCILMGVVSLMGLIGSFAHSFEGTEGLALIRVMLVITIIFCVLLGFVSGLMILGSKRVSSGTD